MESAEVKKEEKNRAGRRADVARSGRKYNNTKWAEWQNRQTPTGILFYRLAKRTM